MGAAAVSHACSIMVRLWGRIAPTSGGDQDRPSHPRMEVAEVRVRPHGQRRRVHGERQPREDVRGRVVREAGVEFRALPRGALGARGHGVRDQAAVRDRDERPPLHLGHPGEEAPAGPAREELPGRELAAVDDGDFRARRPAAGNLKRADHPRVELAVERVRAGGKASRRDRERLTGVQQIQEHEALAAEQDRRYRRRRVEHPIRERQHQRQAGRKRHWDAEGERRDGVRLQAVVREDDIAARDDRRNNRTESERRTPRELHARAHMDQIANGDLPCRRGRGQWKDQSRGNHKHRNRTGNSNANRTTSPSGGYRRAGYKIRRKPNPGNFFLQEPFTGESFLPTPHAIRFGLRVHRLREGGPAVPTIPEEGRGRGLRTRAISPRTSAHPSNLYATQVPSLRAQDGGRLWMTFLVAGAVVHDAFSGLVFLFGGLSAIGSRKLVAKPLDTVFTVARCPRDWTRRISGYWNRPWPRPRRN